MNITIPKYPKTLSKT